MNPAFSLVKKRQGRCKFLKLPGMSQYRITAI